MGKAVGDGALTALDSTERRYRGAYQAGHPNAAGSPKRLDDGDIEQLLAWLEVRDGQVTELFQLLVGCAEGSEAVVGQAFSSAGLPGWKALIEADNRGGIWAVEVRISAREL